MPTRVMKMGGGICRGDERVFFEDDDEKKVKLGFVKINSCNSDESSSSIGENSDLSQNSMEKLTEDCDEVQSPFKDAIEALEQVLPTRKGISRFYNGKSKSFTTLAEASSSSPLSSSIKHIAKPENPYIRRRRNLLAYNLTLHKNRVSSLRSNGGGTFKKATTSNRTSNLALAVAMNSEGAEEPKNSFSAWRSFSLADLHQCVSVDTKVCTVSDKLDETKQCCLI
ncbi:hypothetical protein ABFS83_05G143300 [Erythranthe nasuta]